MRLTLQFEYTLGWYETQPWIFYTNLFPTFASPSLFLAFENATFFAQSGNEKFRGIPLIRGPFQSQFKHYYSHTPSFPKSTLPFCFARSVFVRFFTGKLFLYIYSPCLLPSELLALTRSLFVFGGDILGIEFIQAWKHQRGRHRGRKTSFRRNLGGNALIPDPRYVNGWETCTGMMPLLPVSFLYIMILHIIPSLHSKQWQKNRNKFSST